MDTCIQKNISVKKWHSGTSCIKTYNIQLPYVAKINIIYDSVTYIHKRIQITLRKTKFTRHLTENWCSMFTYFFKYLDVWTYNEKLHNDPIAAKMGFDMNYFCYPFCWRISKLLGFIQGIEWITRFLFTLTPRLRQVNSQRFQVN